jgi:hypothetical protein
MGAPSFERIPFEGWASAKERDFLRLIEATKTGRALWIAALCASISIVCLAIPIVVIRPFRSQDPGQLAFALTVRNAAPWISALCLLLLLWIDFALWKRATRLFTRIVLVCLSALTLVAACLAHVNIFEIMFHPYPSPAFADAKSVQIDADDKLLSVTIGAETHAYPIRTMGYHHVVNDTVGGTAIAATYCTLCHAGLVWNRVMDGRTLYFRLAGINNGNALIRDEQTGSIWQQSTGQAIFGPLKGRQLDLVHSDELTFSLWRAERPNGLVLKPNAEYAQEYDSKDWETNVEKTRTVIDTQKSGIAPHELMLGLTASGQSKAYPVKSILAARLIQDTVGRNPVVIVVGPDQASIRVFQASIAASSMTFVPLESVGHEPSRAMMQDTETGSEWDFKGCATTGEFAGQCLKPLDANKDYWFDWMNHHPSTAVFRN